MSREIFCYGGPAHGRSHPAVGMVLLVPIEHGSTRLPSDDDPLPTSAVEMLAGLPAGSLPLRPEERGVVAEYRLVGVIETDLRWQYYGERRAP